MFREFKEDTDSSFDIFFDEMGKRSEGRAKRSRKRQERLNGRLEGLKHEMQHSRPTVEAGARGEKTGERKEDAVVNWKNGDIHFTNTRGESPSGSAQEKQVYLNNLE